MARRHEVTYVVEEMSSLKYKGKAQNNSVESAKSYCPNVPINEAKRLEMLCRLSQLWLSPKKYFQVLAVNEEGDQNTDFCPLI